MGTPVNGTTSQGSTATKVPPVVVAGIDSDGNVIPIKVDASGVIQIAVP